MNVVQMKDAMEARKVEYRDLTPAELSKFADYDNHETIRRFVDLETGIVGFCAVHNTNLGPSLGGCRITTYQSEEEAITDALRLSRGMTYKNALAGLPIGGGKTVVMADPFTQKTESLIQAIAETVDSLEGHYITAEDSGTNDEDMVYMSQFTKYVTGIPSKDADFGGNPSPYTAYGVYMGVKKTAQYRFGCDTLKGLTVAVQGLGAVGFDLCRHLHKDGVNLIVTDIRPETCKKAVDELPGTIAVSPEEIFGVEADIFAPCAMGAQINDETIPQLKVKAVAGAANNQLATIEHGKILAEKGILYAPDYVVNSAGVIAASCEYFVRVNQFDAMDYEMNEKNIMAHIETISTTLDKIFKKAESEDMTTARAADILAESIFGKGSNQATLSNAG